MTKGYNELVGLQATFSRVRPRYSLTHLYRWQPSADDRLHGILRGYDMQRQDPMESIASALRNAYAPAILSIWRKVTKASWSEYLQFEVGARPVDIGLPGEWKHWAQW